MRDVVRNLRKASKFMFPFTITYKSNLKKSLSEIERTNSLAFLKHYIEKSKGRDVIVSENCLSFKSDLFFGWSWDKFALIDKGSFKLTENILSFRFNVTRIFIIA